MLALSELDPSWSALLLLAALLVASVLYLRTRSSSKKAPTTNNATPSSTQTRTTPLPVQDVWADRRAKGIAAANFQKQESYEGPFGSSYYYAHNSNSTKGGYSDGLRMEDYTMNGPRLLSKGGKQVEEAEELKQDESEEAPPILPSDHNLQRPPSLPPKPTRDIQRYLWDDPGTGIASLRIDSLPGRLSTDTIPWNQVQVNSLDVQLVDQTSLRLVIDTPHFVYRLHIPRLYGPVRSVEAKQLSKRLVLKLHKERKAPWPRPHE